jgi:hypothetical protein
MVGIRPVPCVAHFYEPILKVLGELTQYQANVFIPVTEELHCRILRALGIDPEDLAQYGTPEEGWCHKGRGNPIGLQRKIVISYQRLHFRHPYTVKGGPLGHWALTPEGVARARELTPVPEPRVGAEPNLTAKFFDKRLKESKTLLPLIRQTIRAKLPVSASSSLLIEDHLQNCLLRLIHRDALRTRILEGLPIEEHHIAQWAVRSAFTDIRNDGTEPLARERFGARTQRERDRGETPEATATQTTPGEVKVVWEEEGTVLEVVDKNSPLSALAAEESLDFQTLWSKVEATVAAKTGTSQTLSVLKMRLEGRTLREIAEDLNVTRHIAASLLTKAKKVARDAWRNMHSEDTFTRPLF